LSHDPNCIFCKIVEGKIPSKKVYEDEELFAFHDIAPWAPVHFMVVPRRHIPSMAQLTPEDAGLMGRIMTLAPKLALEQGCNPYPEAVSEWWSTPAARAGRRCTISMSTSWAARGPGPAGDPGFRRTAGAPLTKIHRFFRSNPWVLFPSGTG